MSRPWKFVILIVVVVSVLFGFKYKKSYYSHPTGQNTAQSGENDNMKISKDSSNASLNKDMISIDAQMNTVDTNSVQVDQSLNDQPIPQAE